MQREPGMSEEDICLAATTLSFDIAGLEIFLPLSQGAKVVVAGEAVARDGRLLAECLADCRATVMQATPSTWRMLLDFFAPSAFSVSSLAALPAWSATAFAPSACCPSLAAAAAASAARQGDAG